MNIQLGSKFSYSSTVALAALLTIVGPACHAATVAYSYDALGRLAVALFPDGTCTGYVYDAAGNRTQYTSSGVAPPTAYTVNLSTYQDVAGSLDPRPNNPSCQALTVSGVGAAAHGSTAIVSGGVGITYTPAAGYTGADGFTYTLMNASGSTTGNVAVNVVAPTLPPLAQNGVFEHIFYIVPPAKVQPSVSNTVSGTSPYGYTVTVTSVTQGARGSVAFNGNVVTYTYPNLVGTNKEISDSFTYTMSDGHGHTAVGTGSVAISVVTNQ
jgi:YD repeat-containing protein